MILDRYVGREIARPFLTIIGVLAVVFFSYSAAVVLNDVVAGLLPVGTILQYVLIKWLIALEVLVPVALYLGVVMGLGRLHADSEMIAMTAAGVGELRVAKVVLLLSLVVALFVSALSLVVRPWAYEQRYLLQAYAEANFEIENVEGRRFFVGPDSRYAAYVDSVDPSERSARKVMFQTQRADKVRIILAEEMYQPVRLPTEPVTVVFIRGHAYQLDREGSRDMSLSFQRLVLHVAGSEPEDPSHKSKTRSTLELRGSTDRKDLAEYQWRLSTPVTTVLLALLAVPLSRSTPRQGRHLREVLALLAYAVFYNLITMAKNLVQEGVVGAFPGLWWPIALLGLSILAALAWPWRKRLIRWR